MKKILLLMLLLISINAIAQDIKNAIAKDTISRKNKIIPENVKDRHLIIEFLSKKIYEELSGFCNSKGQKSTSIKLSGKNFFEQRLKTVFSTVVTTTSDVVENGSAFSYVKDKDANTISVNGATYKSTKKDHKYIFDIGISSKMESNDYKFYAKGSFSNDVTGSFGISRAFWFTNKYKYYKDYISECDSINQIRWQFVNDTLIPKYNKLYKWVYNPELLKKPLPNELRRKKGKQQQGFGLTTKDSLYVDEKDDLKNAYVAATIRIIEINNIIKDKFKFSIDTTKYKDPLKTKTTITDKKAQSQNLSTGTITVDGVKTADITVDTSNGEKTTLVESKEEDLKKELADLIEIRNTAIELLRLREEKAKCEYDDPVQSYIDKKFEKFDATHDKSYGYSIFWTTLKTSLSNSSITINNQDIIDETIQTKIDNVFKLSSELSINFSYSMKWFHYIKLYSKFNRGSLLDSQILKTNGFNVFAETSTTPTSYTIQNNDGITVANYDQLRHPVYNMDLGGYYAFLIGTPKLIGFSLQASFNFPFEGTEIEYKPNYTLLLGLLVKAKADAVIINLSSGFENQYYSTNAWDNFIVKASVGVPFTIFEKKAAK